MPYKVISANGGVAMKNHTEFGNTYTHYVVMQMDHYLRSYVHGITIQIALTIYPTTNYT